CYNRWWTNGRKLPAFSIHVSPPPKPDSTRIAAIARRSRDRFGRPGELVRADIEAVLAQRGGMRNLPTAEVAQDEGSEERAEGDLAPTQHVDPKIPAE